jgi:ABC-2 type transport system ATP-binding protein
MAKGAAIRASRLTRRFGENEAVAGIDLSVESGEIYGFLGPNGAGKSTTVRMLVTLLSPSGGDAWVLGRSVKEEPEAVRLGIGVALQDAALDGQQTGVELLRLQGRLYGLSRKEVEHRLGALRELIDIGGALDERIKSYSGGMRRRLDLAAALVHNPEVLFLDEPTTGLDPVSRARVWEEVKRLNEALGMTIFLTTQYLEEADRLADRVGIISEGKIVAEGAPEELKRRVGNDLVVVRTRGELNGIVEKLRSLGAVDRVDVYGEEITVATPDGPGAIGRVAVAFDESGVEVEQLTMRTTTLDDVFLEVTGNRLRAAEDEEGEKE